MAKNILLVSGDAHAGALPEGYRQYFEPEFRSTIDQLKADDAQFMTRSIMQTRYSPEQLELIDEREAIRTGGLAGGVDDVPRRLREMDAEGMAAELLCPGHQFATLPFFSIINRPASVELRAAGARAYHRYLADMISQSNRRLYGLGEPGPCYDMKATIKEMEWIVAHGFPSIQPPGATGDAGLPPIGDAHYEPFWSACEDLGLVLTAHIGYAAPQRDVSGLMDSGVVDENEPPLEEDRLSLRTGSQADTGLLKNVLYAVRRFAAQLMVTGVLDRHPKLKIVMTECRADWVPATIAAMDREFAAGTLSMKMKPSEYWRRHFFVTPSSPRKYEVAMRHEIGVTQLMFGTDYPHPEGTWPNTHDWIRTTFDGVPEAEARLILGENAVNCYNLDRAHLEGIAARIGPSAAQLLSGADRVKPALVADFHKRAGYANTPEAVEVADIPEFFREEEHMVVM